MDASIEKTRETIEIIAELIRYRIYDSDSKKTTFAEENQYISSFIKLQRIRLTDKIKIEYVYDEKLDNYEVYPFLMIPVIENAFKFAGGKMWISIIAKYEIAFSRC